jgi:hypothetical protein
MIHFPVQIFCLLKEMLYFCGGSLSPDKIRFEIFQIKFGFILTKLYLCRP